MEIVGKGGEVGKRADRRRETILCNSVIVSRLLE